MHNILQLWNQFGSGTYGAFPWQICDFTPKLRSNLSPTILKQQIFEFFARCKPRWTNFCLVGSLGTSQWEASDIWHFFSWDVRKGHHPKHEALKEWIFNACWFLSLYFESCCFQKPHIFQPFSLFNKNDLPRVFAYFCTMSFSYVTLHIWTHLADWETNANDRWKYPQDCLHL